jgi:hypothetical protein
MIKYAFFLALILLLIMPVVAVPTISGGLPVNSTPVNMSAYLSLVNESYATIIYVDTAIAGLGSLALNDYYLNDTSKALYGSDLYRNVNTGNLNLFGGTTGGGKGGIVSVQGKDLAANDAIVFYVPDMTYTGNLIAAKFIGGVAQPYLSMMTRQIKNMGDPTDAQDAVTKKYLDDVNATIQPSIGGGTGGQILYFNHSASADIAGFEGLGLIPAGNVEADESVTVKTGLGEVSIDPYVTNLGSPGITNIHPGLWRFRTFHYVDKVNGNTNAVFKVYNRTAGGVETLLFTATSEDINALSVQEYLTSYVQATDIPLLLTDRIEIKVYGQSDHASNVIFHFVYDGTIHTSHVLTPIETLSSLYIRKDGTVPFTGSQSMGGHNLTQVKTVTGASDAANKSYVDDAVAAGGTATWANYAPVLTWADGTPAGVVTVARYIKVGKVVTFTIDILSADSNGATGLTISLPEAPANNGNRIAVTSIQRVGGT